MTDRSQKLMDAIWQDRDNGANTESKLVAAIIRRTTEHVRTMTAQKLNNLTVLDKGDMMTLSKEVESL
jgi:hypothetical protein